MAVLQYTTSTSGTVTMNDTGQDVDLIHDAGATVTLTIAFPATPFNGQKVRLTSVGGITTMTLTSGGTITNALTTLSTGIGCHYVYVAAQTKWYKL